VLVATLQPQTAAPPAATPAAATVGASTSQPALPATAAGPATQRPTLEPRPTPVEGTYLPLTVDATGYTAVSSDGNDYATYGAVFTNPNTEWAVYRMLVELNFYGADDAFIAGEELSLTILPGQTTAVAGQSFGAGGAVRFEVVPPEDPSPYVPFVSAGTIVVTDVQMAATETGTLTTGSLTSSLTTDQTFLQLFAVYKDAGGAIVGGTTSAIEALASGATVPFEISDSQPPPDAATVDVYWQLGGQLPQQP
jgi:hypothetical protein